MTIFLHELRQGRRAFLIWTAVIAGMLALCVFLYPEMRGELAGVNEMFASMGAFTAAFGMDQINFGSLTGYYAVECGNVLGMGGAFYAALIGVSALANEEKEHTAEFLLAHPVSRARVLAEKFAAVAARIVAMNLLMWAIAVAAVAMIGESVPILELTLIHLAYLCLQLEIAGVCFGLSAFVRRGGAGLGIGLAALLYFLNIAANITERARFLKYFTPFGYTEGAEILANGALDLPRILLGAGYAVLAAAAGCFYYARKDIR